MENCQQNAGICPSWRFATFNLLTFHNIHEIIAVLHKAIILTIKNPTHSMIISISMSAVEEKTQIGDVFTE